MPPAARDGRKEIKLALVVDDDRVSAGAVRDISELLFEIVLIIDVEGIAVGFLTRELALRGRCEVERNRTQNTEEQTETHITQNWAPAFARVRRLGSDLFESPPKQCVQQPGASRKRLLTFLRRFALLTFGKQATIS